MCPGDYDPISAWINTLERNQCNQANVLKPGQKRTAFEFTTEYKEQSKEHGHGIQTNKKLKLMEDRHILMKGIAQLNKDP